MATSIDRPTRSLDSPGWASRLVRPARPPRQGLLASPWRLDRQSRHSRDLPLAVPSAGARPSTEPSSRLRLLRFLLRTASSCRAAESTYWSWKVHQAIRTPERSPGRRLAVPAPAAQGFCQESISPSIPSQPIDQVGGGDAVGEGSSAATGWHSFGLSNRSLRPSPTIAVFLTTDRKFWPAPAWWPIEPLRDERGCCNRSGCSRNIDRNGGADSKLPEKVKALQNFSPSRSP